MALQPQVSGVEGALLCGNRVCRHVTAQGWALRATTWGVKGPGRHWYHWVNNTASLCCVTLVLQHSNYTNKMYLSHILWSDLKFSLFGDSETQRLRDFWLGDSVTRWLGDSVTQRLRDSETQRLGDLWLGDSVTWWFSDSVTRWLRDSGNQRLRDLVHSSLRGAFLLCDSATGWLRNSETQRLGGIASMDQFPNSLSYFPSILYPY